MKKNIIYFVLILALVVTTIVNVYDRMTVESEAKSVEITMPYEDMEALSKQSEESLLWWFKHLGDLGVQSVAVSEETLETLIKRGYELEVEVLHNLKKDTLWETRYPKAFVDYIQEGDFDLNDAVMVSADQDLKTFVLEGLKERYPDDFYQVFENGDHYAILFDGLHEDLQYNQIYKSIDTAGKPIVEHQDIVGSDIFSYGINFDDDKIKTIQDAGLDVNLRPWNNMRFPDKLIEAYDNELKTHDIQARMLIFAGKEVLGYPGNHVELYEYMTENKITPVLIETGVQRSNTDQKGLMQLTTDMNYEAVRLMALVGYLQERFQHYNYEGAEEIENVMFRAITERNVRVIYFRPFLKDAKTYIVDPEEYTASFKRFSDRLKAHDITLGEFSVMPLKTDSLIGGVVTGFGLVAILILAARYFFRMPEKLEYILLVLGGLAIAGALFVAPNLGRQLLALAGAMTISCVGAILLISYSRDLVIDKKVFKLKNLLARAAVFGVLMSLLALLGGMIVGGLLSHSKYLLEMEFFRGVKISEMLPLAVFIIIYFLKFGYNRTASELKDHDILPKDLLRVLNERIKISYILVAAIAGGILYIYIARSGHETTVQPSNIEMIFRNFLEWNLLARPRTKEFLFAIPAIVVFAYVSMKAYKPLIPFVGVPAMVTFTSIINTFCHLRTPIYISVVRTLIAIGFGVIIGLVGILVFEGLLRLGKRLMKISYESDEERELGA